MEYMQDWGKTKKRFEAFWRGEVVDRCMAAVFAPKNNAHHQPLDFPADKLGRVKYWTDGELLLDRNLKLFETTYFCGDAFPQIFLNLGAAGHAGFFQGASCQWTQNTVWFDPIIHDIEAFQLQFDDQSFLFQKTLELAEYLTRESNGRYFVSMPDTSGNLDALAHLRGSENLLVDLLDEKAWVHASLEKIQRAWLTTAEKTSQILSPHNDGGCTIGWLNTWGHGRHSQMQCDISVMISPEMFHEFVVPELCAQSAWMDESLYHFDGIEQIRHLDLLLSIDTIDAIQWTCVDGQPSPIQYLPELKRIQAAGKKLVLRHSFRMDELRILMEELSSKGLLIVAYTGSEEEADTVLKLVSQSTHD